MRQCFAAVAVAASLLPHAKPEQVRLYYFPMFVTAPRPGNIEDQYDLTRLLKTDTKWLLEIVRHKDLPSQEYDEGQTRVRIKLPGETIDVDTLGNVRDKDGIHRLDLFNRRRLHRAIQACLPDDMVDWSDRKPDLAGGQGEYRTQRPTEGSYPIRIYYFNMYAQTCWGPIDPESQYDLTDLLHDEASTIIQILRQKDESGTRFMDDQIRMRLKLPGEIIEMDVAGDVRDKDGIHKLSRDTRKRLFKAIQRCLPDDMIDRSRT